MKLLKPLLLLLICLPMASAQFRTSNVELALQLALEHNIQSLSISQTCGLFSQPTTTIIVLPLNSEVLNAAINYVGFIQDLSENEKTTLLARAREVFIQGNEAIFLLVVLNPLSMKPSALSLISPDSILLQDEFNSYSLLRLTPIFDANQTLGPGMNKGYVYFENFRQNRSWTYAFKINSVYLDLCEQKGELYPVSFSFDESDLNFFRLIEKGFSADLLRQQHSIRSYSDHGISSQGFLDLVGLVLDIIGLVR